MKYVRGETSAIGTLVLFVVFIVGLGIFWVYTGGPQRTASRSGPLLSQPLIPGIGNVPAVAPSTGTSGGGTGTGGTGVTTTPSVWDLFYGYGSGVGSEEASPYAPDVYLENGSANNTSPANEYLVIRTSSNLKNPVTLTGWTLENTSGVKVKIGQAAYLPFLGEVNAEQAITAKASSYIYVTTGRSPNGISFRTNLCTGYFEQFQDYTPSLRMECPYPADEMLKFPEQVAGNEQCINFIRSMGRCQLYVNALPGNIGSSCNAFISTQLTYNGCTNNHKNEASFYKDEWRVYLNRDQELWKSQYERIRLLDENGKLIDAITY